MGQKKCSLGKKTWRSEPKTRALIKTCICIYSFSRKREKDRYIERKKEALLTRNFFDQNARKQHKTIHYCKKDSWVFLELWNYYLLYTFFFFFQKKKSQLPTKPRSQVQVNPNPKIKTFHKNKIWAIKKPYKANPQQ